MSKVLRFGYMTVLTFCHHHTKLIVAFDRIPLHYKDTLTYLDPKNVQTYVYATSIPCDIIPRGIIELDPDADDQDFNSLLPEPIKRRTSLMFTSSQRKTTIQPNTFTAQDVGIYSRELFFEYILVCRSRSILEQINFFSKNLDTTLQILGKTNSY